MERESWTSFLRGAAVGVVEVEGGEWYPVPVCLCRASFLSWLLVVLRLMAVWCVDFDCVSAVGRGGRVEIQGKGQGGAEHGVQD